MKRIVAGAFACFACASIAEALYAVVSNRTEVVGSDTQPGDRFGTAVAMDGVTAAVGASLHDLGAATDAGAVYVYRFQGWDQGSGWAEEAKLIADVPARSTSSA